MTTSNTDSSGPASADTRAEAAAAWAATVLAAPLTHFAPASADASFRRYFRCHVSDVSYIVMDAPPEHEDNAAFVRVAQRMRAAGLHVPEVISTDMTRGFLLLSDLGKKTYLDVMSLDNAEGYFARARAALLQWQRATEPDALPRYDRALLLRETGLFDDWFLQRHLGVTLSAQETGMLAETEMALAERALTQAQVFVHRDFMPRNLMAGHAQAGVLDFQDAVVGPVSYDAVSLYRDAFVSWPEAMVRDGLGAYHAEALAAGIPVPTSREIFLADCDWMGLQRHLKILGIFARLTLRDGKPKYLADTPRFVDYVMQVLLRYRELHGLQRLFETHVLPRL